LELLLADRAFLCQRLVPRHIELRLGELRLRPLEVAHSLIEGGLKLSRVNLEQEIAFFDCPTFPVFPLQ